MELNELNECLLEMPLYDSSFKAVFDNILVLSMDAMGYAIVPTIIVIMLVMLYNKVFKKEKDIMLAGTMALIFSGIGVGLYMITAQLNTERELWNYILFKSTITAKAVNNEKMIVELGNTYNKISEQKTERWELPKQDLAQYVQTYNQYKYTIYKYAQENKCS